jgi:hypothetical protein
LFTGLKILSGRRRVSFMAGKNNNPKSRKTELVVQELKDEVLIYDLNINKAYCLNPTSAAIWNLCDGNNTVSEITGQLSKKLKQPVTDDLVWLALDQFKQDNLLADNAEVQIKFDGLSRREVIRKIGLASMIALPVISSLIAPHAADAASCLGTGSQIGLCVGQGFNCATVQSQCCSGSATFDVRDMVVGCGGGSFGLRLGKCVCN